jgi:hypothetical protein
MGVPKKRATGEAMRVLADRLFATCVLPDEDETDYRGLEMALEQEFAPRTTMERLVVGDLVALEWEKRRLRRWIQSILQREIKSRMAAAFRRSLPEGLHPGDPVEPLVHTWMTALPDHRHTIDARIRRAGIDPAAIVFEAYEAQEYAVRRFEVDLRPLDVRRRRLIDDLRGLQARRARPVADAEIVED